jgi:Phosphodiester glycosidase
MPRRDMPVPPLRLSFVCVAAALALAPGANAAGGVASPAAHARTLAPGVVLGWQPQAPVAGAALPTQLVTITWPLGDPRYRMRTVMTGGPIAADGFLPRRHLSAWGATQPASLVAAISPDFATYLSGRAMPSGLEVAGRVIVHLPTAGAVAPSVGYTSGGRLVFGTVRAQPIAFQLPGGQTATVEAVNAAPKTGAQVGAYHTAGARVAVPTGDRAVILQRSPFATSVRAPPGVASFAALPAAYALHQSERPVQYLTTPISRPAAGATGVTVPVGGAVLVVRSGGSAAAGFDQLLAGPQPQVLVNVTDQAWAGVTDVMGGKPILVKDGTAVTVRPPTMTDYQWSGTTARIALGETADGRGVIAMLNGGNRSTAGVTAPELAAALLPLGVTNAIAFDAGPVPEMYSLRYRNRTCLPSPGWCYRSSKGETTPALASALYYTP